MQDEPSIVVSGTYMELQPRAPPLERALTLGHHPAWQHVPCWVVVSGGCSRLAGPPSVISI